MSANHKFLIAMALTLALSSCKQEAPVEVAPVMAPTPPVEPAAPPPPPMPAVTTVVAVNLGTAVGDDQKVTAAKTSFSANDVIYVSIDTQNAQKDVLLSVKWTDADGKLVHEDSNTISPEGDATNNFKHSGLAAGKYKVEVALNGTPAQTVDVEVK